MHTNSSNIDELNKYVSKLSEYPVRYISAVGKK